MLKVIAVGIVSATARLGAIHLSTKRIHKANIKYSKCIHNPGTESVLFEKISIDDKYCRIANLKKYEMTLYPFEKVHKIDGPNIPLASSYFVKYYKEEGNGYYFRSFFGTLYIADTSEEIEKVISSYYWSVVFMITIMAFIQEYISSKK